MTTDTLQLPPVADSRAWARVFAAMYDPFLWIGERAGMRRHRRDLLTEARGRTLEIGSGTGLNLLHYPDDLDSLVLAEPDPSMRRRLKNAVRRSDRNAKVIDAGAEHLPFGDATIDTVVSTLVLCTVGAPDIALREIERVLRPDGQLLFIEHVRSDSPLLARWQDRLARPWRRFAEGCRCNRATLELMDACGFRLDAHPAKWRAMPPIIRPLVVGRATIGARSAVPDLSASTAGSSSPSATIRPPTGASTWRRST
jgi:SAM-dependent methyltransferase